MARRAPESLAWRKNRARSRFSLHRLVAARFFSDHPNPDGYSLADLWKPGVGMLIPFTLIMLQGDLGTSLYTKRPVAEEIKTRFPVTFSVAIGSSGSEPRES